MENCLVIGGLDPDKNKEKYRYYELSYLRLASNNSEGPAQE